MAAAAAAAAATAATDGPCSVADGGAKRLSDFVVNPDSSLRRLSLPGFPLLPRAAFRLSRAGRATPRTCPRTETRLFIPTTAAPLGRPAIPTTPPITLRRTPRRVLTEGAEHRVFVFNV